MTAEVELSPGSGCPEEVAEQMVEDLRETAAILIESPTTDGIAKPVYVLLYYMDGKRVVRRAGTWSPEVIRYWESWLRDHCAGKKVITIYGCGEKVTVWRANCIWQVLALLPDPEKLVRSGPP